MPANPIPMRERLSCARRHPIKEKQAMSRPIGRLTAAIAALALAACSTSTTSSGGRLEGTAWRAESIDDRPLTSSSKAPCASSTASWPAARLAAMPTRRPTSRMRRACASARLRRHGRCARHRRWIRRPDSALRCKRRAVHVSTRKARWFCSMRRESHWHVCCQWRRSSSPQATLHKRQSDAAGPRAAGE
jgi:hypothetical protein